MQAVVVCGSWPCAFKGNVVVVVMAVVVAALVGGESGMTKCNGRKEGVGHSLRDKVRRRWDSYAARVLREII